MSAGSYRAIKRKQAAQPAPSVAQIRSRAIKRLLLLAEMDEAPATSIAACRALLDLPPESAPVEAALASDEDRRATAARLVAEAFAEVMQRDKPKQLSPAPAPAAMTEAMEALPDPAEPAETVNIGRDPKPIPFDRKYGRRLNRHY